MVATIVILFVALYWVRSLRSLIQIQSVLTNRYSGASSGPVMRAAQSMAMILLVGILLPLGLFPGDALS